DAAQEREQRALTGLVRAEEYRKAGAETAELAVVKNTEAVDVPAFDLHGQGSPSSRSSARSSASRSSSAASSPSGDPSPASSPVLSSGSARRRSTRRTRSDEKSPRRAIASRSSGPRVRSTIRSTHTNGEARPSSSRTSRSSSSIAPGRRR